METLADLKRKYYLEVTGLPNNSTLSDLEYAFFKGMVEGSISSGGVTSEELATALAAKADQAAMTTALATKATTASVTALTTRVTTAEGKITAEENKSANFETRIAALEAP